MTIKKYTIWRVAIIIALSMTISISVNMKNYLIPIIAMMVAVVVLQLLRRRVKVVMADERDYAIAGHAARWALYLYCLLAVMAMFVLLALSSINPYFEAIAYTLAYSSCFLMLVSALLFHYWQRLVLIDRKKIILASIIAVMFGMFIAGIRLFSGEDNWYCHNGEWVRHGQPNFSAPAAYLCK